MMMNSPRALLLVLGFGIAALAGLAVLGASRSGENGEETNEPPAEVGAMPADAATTEGAPSAATHNPSGSSAVVVPAPAASSVSGPYRSPIGDTRAAHVTIRRTVSEGERISLAPQVDATLILTNIAGTEGSFQLRSDTEERSKTIAAGSSTYLGTFGSYTITLDLFSVIPSDNRASIRVHLFPATRAAPRVPATVWVYPFQTFFAPNLATGNTLKVEPTTILSNKIQVRLTELENGGLSRTYTQWIRVGEMLDTRFFTLRLNDIVYDSDTFYDSSLAVWGPHLSEFTVTAR